MIINIIIIEYITQNNPDAGQKSEIIIIGKGRDLSGEKDAPLYNDGVF
jgi:hypothetical protein